MVSSRRDVLLRRHASMMISRGEAPWSLCENYHKGMYVVIELLTSSSAMLAAKMGNGK